MDKGKYIVWENYSEGWSPSEPFNTLQEAVEYAMKENYGSKIKVTKVVDFEVIAKEV